MQVLADRLDPQINDAGQGITPGTNARTPISVDALPLNHPVVPAAEVAITPTRPVSRLISASAQRCPRAAPRRRSGAKGRLLKPQRTGAVRRTTLHRATYAEAE
jgi:hypothetical protein